MSNGSTDEKSPERLIALSDGIFAIAMTLLVLDIRLPTGLNSADFRDAVHKLLPNIGAYALSFAILAIFWRDHRRILQIAQRVDTLSMRLALAGLGAIALVPFPTSMLSEYASEPLSVAVYAATVALVDLLHLALFVSIWRRPHLARPVDAHAARHTVGDLTTTILVFGATIPIAFASPSGAMWTWLSMVPLKFALTSWQNRRRPSKNP
ncbi:TMEM175 family protein [Streptomyces sp. NPDC091292]|uniref:TMEM175 family protein n=1 Tax=Streptomyces sp. NPDC091292 TaxID=3365991 RepID=UPI0038287978